SLVVRNTVFDSGHGRILRICTVELRWSVIVVSHPTSPARTLRASICSSSGRQSGQNCGQTTLGRFWLHDAQPMLLRFSPPVKSQAERQSPIAVRSVPLALSTNAPPGSCRNRFRRSVLQRAWTYRRFLKSWRSCTVRNSVHADPLLAAL